MENNNQVERPVSPESRLLAIKITQVVTLFLALLSCGISSYLVFEALKSWGVDVIIVVVSILFSLLVDWAFIQSQVKESRVIRETILGNFWTFIRAIEAIVTFQGMHVLLNLPEHQWRWYILLIIILGLLLLVLIRMLFVFGTSSLITKRKKVELEIELKKS